MVLDFNVAGDYYLKNELLGVLEFDAAACRRLVFGWLIKDRIKFTCVGDRILE